MDNDVSKLNGVDSEVTDKRRAAWREATKADFDFALAVV
jgi:phage gp16-like protein